MKISIIGLGWFGSALATDLIEKYKISGTTRTPDKVTLFKSKNIDAELLLPPDSPSSQLLNSDIIILNIPPFLGQLEWFKSWHWNNASHLIFISSTSVYGDEGITVDENTHPFPNTENGKILIEEENWIKTFSKHTIIRFGGLLGNNRHPGKFLSGRKNLTGGQTPVNLIHLDDTIGFTKLVIEKKLFGETFNLVHPNHPTRSEYYEKYCHENHLPLPEFDSSGAKGKIVSAKKVSELYSFKRSI